MQQRGVRFEFFQAVRNLELSDDKQRVARIRMGRQVTLKHPPYQPLVDVKGLPCWPSEPFFDQRVEGAALKAGGFDLEDYWTKWKDVESYTLELGKDFDAVVLGISVAGIPLPKPPAGKDAGTYAGAKRWRQGHLDSAGAGLGNVQGRRRKRHEHLDRFPGTEPQTQRQVGFVTGM